MVSGDVDILECPCGRQFRRDATFERHMNFSHRTVKLHKCSICSKITPSARALQLHRHTHRPTLCRTEDMKTIEPISKPDVEMTCEDKFEDSDNLECSSPEDFEEMSSHDEIQADEDVQQTDCGDSGISTDETAVVDGLDEFGMEVDSKIVDEVLSMEQELSPQLTMDEELRSQDLEQNPLWKFFDIIDSENVIEQQLETEDIDLPDLSTSLDNSNPDGKTAYGYEKCDINSTSKPNGAYNTHLQPNIAELKRNAICNGNDMNSETQVTPRKSLRARKVMNFRILAEPPFYIEADYGRRKSTGGKSQTREKKKKPVISKCQDETPTMHIGKPIDLNSSDIHRDEVTLLNQFLNLSPSLKENEVPYIYGTDEPSKEANHLICNVCQRRFETEKYLTMHMSLHQVISEGNITVKVEMDNDDSPVTISQPANGIHPVVVTKEDIAKYMVRSNSGWSCKICGKKFASNSNVVNHLRTHSDERPFVCTICQIGFKEKYHLQKHIRFKHSSERPCKCRYCGKRFKDSTAVRAHERIHSSERPFQCRKCGKTFKTTECLWHHEHRSKSCGEGKDFFFEDDKQLPVEHGIVKKPTPVMMVQNDSCNKRKREDDEAVSDLQASQRVENIINCVVSTKPEPQKPLPRVIVTQVNAIPISFITSMTTLSTNVVSNSMPRITHHNVFHSAKTDSDSGTSLSGSSSPIGDEPYLRPQSVDSDTGDETVEKRRCKTCQKVFATAAGMERHHNTLHIEQRAHICYICDVGFKIKSHLQRHNLYLHSNDYPFTCELCGRKFKDSSTMKKHFKIHEKRSNGALLQQHPIISQSAKVKVELNYPQQTSPHSTAEAFENSPEHLASFAATATTAVNGILDVTANGINKMFPTPSESNPTIKSILLSKRPVHLPSINSLVPTTTSALQQTAVAPCTTQTQQQASVTSSLVVTSVANVPRSCRQPSYEDESKASLDKNHNHPTTASMPIIFWNDIAEQKLGVEVKLESL